MTTIKALYARWRVLVHEVAKFGIVGLANTILHFGLANLLHFQLHLGPLTANGLAIAVATTSSYWMNRHWTFRHRARTGLSREYSLFFVLNGVGFLISEGSVAFTRYVLGLEGPLAYNAALAAGVAVGMVFRFLTYKRWVFVEPDEAAARAIAEIDVAELGDLPEPGEPVSAEALRRGRRRRKLPAAERS
jgi:putative flippase GtrA